MKALTIGIILNLALCADLAFAGIRCIDLVTGEPFLAPGNSCPAGSAPQ